MSNVTKAIALATLAMESSRDEERDVAAIKLRRLLQRDNSLLSLTKVREFLGFQIGYSADPQPSASRPSTSTDSKVHHRYYARDVRIDFETDIGIDSDSPLHRVNVSDFWRRGGNFEIKVEANFDDAFADFVKEMEQRARAVEYERQVADEEM